MARHAATRDLLGAFALGAVDTEEASSVREHLATCAECQVEIAGLWAAVDSLPAMIVPMDPPPARRDRIAAAVLAETAAEPPAAATVVAPPTPQLAPTITPTERAPEPIRPPVSFWSRATPWMAA